VGPASQEPPCPPYQASGDGEIDRGQLFSRMTT